MSKNDYELNKFMSLIQSYKAAKQNIKINPDEILPLLYELRQLRQSKAANDSIFNTLLTDDLFIVGERPELKPLRIEEYRHKLTKIEKIMQYFCKHEFILWKEIFIPFGYYTKGNEYECICRKCGKKVSVFLTFEQQLFIKSVKKNKEISL